MPESVNHMYADFVLDIWLEIGFVVVIVVITIMGLLRALRQARKSTELRMYATVEASKLKHKQATSFSDGGSGLDPKDKKGE